MMALLKMTFKLTSIKWNWKCRKSGSKMVSPQLKASTSSTNWQEPLHEPLCNRKIVTAVISAVRTALTRALTV